MVTTSKPVDKSRHRKFTKATPRLTQAEFERRRWEQILDLLRFHGHRAAESEAAQ